jgi:hypothetical protein
MDSNFILMQLQKFMVLDTTEMCRPKMHCGVFANGKNGIWNSDFSMMALICSSITHRVFSGAIVPNNGFGNPNLQISQANLLQPIEEI